MNTSSKPFQDLTHQYPDELRAIQELERLFLKNRKTRLALNGVMELARPSSKYALLRILCELESAGCITKSYLVVSPTNGEGIGEYADFMEIPNQIEDWRSHSEVIPVTPTLVQVIYKSV